MKALKTILREVFVFTSITAIIWFTVKGFQIIFLKVATIEETIWLIICSIAFIIGFLIIDILLSKLFFRVLTSIINISLYRDKSINIFFLIVRIVIILISIKTFITIISLYNSKLLGIGIGLIYLFMVSVITGALNSIIEKALHERSMKYFGIRNFL